MGVLIIDVQLKNPFNLKVPDREPDFIACSGEDDPNAGDFKLYYWIGERMLMQTSGEYLFVTSIKIEDNLDIYWKCCNGDYIIEEQHIIEAFSKYINDMDEILLGEHSGI